MSGASAVAKAKAPASLGNCAVGFDVLGHALDGPHDEVEVARTHSGEVRVVVISGTDAELPMAAEDNTASRAVLALRERAGDRAGFEVAIHKGIPLASGMGGSAASAVAAAVAANALLPEPLPVEDVYAAACEGEAAASGAPHGDNVAPSLLGGLVIAPATGAPVRVPVPERLHVALVHPHLELETRRARAVLDAPYALSDFVAQSEGLALVLAGCYTGDLALLRRGLRDVLVEPRRAELIPGFAEVKRAALECDALGASISGAGPSVFGWFDSLDAAERGADAMQAAFESAGLANDRVVCPVDAPGAELVA